MTRVEVEKEWETRVAAFIASGQSTKEWCESHNLKPSQLRYWLQKLKQIDTATVISPKWMSVVIGEDMFICRNNPPHERKLANGGKQLGF